MLNCAENNIISGHLERIKRQAGRFSFSFRDYYFRWCPSIISEKDYNLMPPTLISTSSALLYCNVYLQLLILKLELVWFVYKNCSPLNVIIKNANYLSIFI